MSVRAGKAMPPEVAAAFAKAPGGAQAAMRRLRALILETAATQGVEPLTETLKWGEPSYAPAKPRIGSSVRIAPRGQDGVALLFICHTGIVERLRELYPDTLRFEANRAIALDATRALPEAELGHCIALALTWHRWKGGL